MKRYRDKIDKFIDNIMNIPFADMDRCMICDRYDTIQTYIKYNNRWIHVCEECYNKTK